ncbi:YrzK family protein, partial [Bacillus subtilis]
MKYHPKLGRAFHDGAASLHSRDH